MDGVYTYCFSNQMSSMTPKTIMFNMEIGEAPKDINTNDGNEIHLCRTCTLHCIYHVHNGVLIEHVYSAY